MNTHRTPRAIARQRGFTMTELIVVLVILLLLTTMLVPVVLNRAQQARLTVAKTECKKLAEAEEQCVLHHGYFVPLQMLDDVAMDLNDPGNLLRDDIRNELSISSLLYVIDPTSDIDSQALGQTSLSDWTVVPQLRDLVENWAGPFIEFKHFYQGTSVSGTQERLRRDFPLDPWGQPYRFYCKRGQIGNPGASLLSSNMTDFDSDQFFNGRLPVTLRDPAQRLDRFAIVSFGPDMKSSNDPSNLDGTQFDDIIYEFGGNYTGRSFKAYR